MPELPEVEAVRRTLRPFAEKRRIRCVHVFHAIATKPQAPGTLARIATGRQIRKVDRKGKYLILELDRGMVVMHFRLDGQLIWFDSRKELLRTANQGAEGVHVDVAFELDKGLLGFADQRHFGRVHGWRSAADCPGLRRLGVDATSAEFRGEILFNLLFKSKKTIKEFLLDQTKVAGIGNIYSCESLWQARIDPTRRANTLKEFEARKLHKAIVSVLRRGLECCLHPPPNFRDEAWWFQGLESILRVYGREGSDCRRCKSSVSRIEQAGRSTYYCKGCQN